MVSSSRGVVFDMMVLRLGREIVVTCVPVLGSGNG
jgi:hypothetical protein